MNGDEKAMIATLAKYQDAANKSDAEAVEALFAPDGVLMAENSDSAVGAEAVGQAYSGMASAIKLDIAFKVEEVRQLSPDWGFARTHSTGTIRLLATGAVIPESNQELFLFQKIDGDWRIARYSFSTILPPQQG
jgi:uncharacterized protein (TIGR02246 family)